ncbi:hypothetical protein SNE40_016671 [Patella caerulea]|uniref:Uncharacterized protein n=1 Tax=Patella caerulea TaxID=87958 RepID=A0AAN8JDI9_PATCE
MSDPMQKEFEVFSRTAEKIDGTIGATANVCSIVIDKGETILTKVFHAKKKDDSRAEDMLLEWIFSEPSVQNGNRLDFRIYMNYPPLNTTSHSLVSGFKSLEEQGKKVKVAIKFVTLHGQGEGDEGKEENKQGLKNLRESGVKLGVFEEVDWLYLLDVLRDPTWIQKQLKGSRAAKKVLREIGKDSDDIEEYESMSKGSEEIPKVLE